jgi:O-antigen ligase
LSVWPSQLRNLVPRQRTSRFEDRDLPLIGLLGVALLVRVLTDDLSAPTSRHSGSLNLSGGIAGLFILMAAGLVLRRRAGARPTMLAAAWLCVWTAIALGTRGASAETLRAGVREASVVALAAIVCNLSGSWTVPVATRLVQVLGLAPALLALYQFATNTGVNLTGELRSNGTFAHPNSAAMFFALAVVISLWRYLDYRRRASDAALVSIFAAALIVTFSIDGLITLVAMLLVFGVLRPGPPLAKCGPYLVAGLTVLTFFATPLGAQRITRESATNVTTAESGNANTSLAWRLHKWKMLLPEWENSPLIGKGLGTTLTAVSSTRNDYTRKPPHNEYIRYLVETGIVGLAILLWGLVILMRDLWRKRRVTGRVEAGTLNAPALAITVCAGCLINALADNTLIDSTTGYAAVLIVATVLSLPGTARR